MIINYKIDKISFNSKDVLLDLEDYKNKNFDSILQKYFHDTLTIYKNPDNDKDYELNSSIQSDEDYILKEIKKHQKDCDGYLSIFKNKEDNHIKFSEVYLNQKKEILDRLIMSSENKFSIKLKLSENILLDNDEKSIFAKKVPFNDKFQVYVPFKIHEFIIYPSQEESKERHYLEIKKSLEFIKNYQNIILGGLVGIAISIYSYFN